MYRKYNVRSHFECEPLNNFGKKDVKLRKKNINVFYDLTILTPLIGTVIGHALSET